MHGRIGFAADEATVAELSQALIEAGALIRALAPQTVTLEDLFFSLTEGDGVGDGFRAASGPRRPRRRRDELGVAPTIAAPRRTRRAGARVATGHGVVYRWELTKLRYQKRTYLGLGAAVIVPILFVVAIHFRHHRDNGGTSRSPSYLTGAGWPCRS